METVISIAQAQKAQRAALAVQLQTQLASENDPVRRTALEKTIDALQSPVYDQIIAYASQ